MVECVKIEDDNDLLFITMRRRMRTKMMVMIVVMMVMTTMMMMVMMIVLAVRDSCVIASQHQRPQIIAPPRFLPPVHCDHPAVVS